MLRIPDEILKTMSTEELIYAIAEYPYLVDIYVYGNSVDDGVQVARKYFSALDELLSRKIDHSYLISCTLPIAKQFQVKADSTRGVESDHYKFVSFALFDILVSLDEELNNNTEMFSLPFDPNSTAIIFTPNDSAVMVFIMEEEFTEEQHALADQKIVSTYGAELLSPGTCRYNCHSYAWYLREPTNPYWLEDTAIYRVDGSYTLMCSPSQGSMTNAYNISTGDIIYYGNHSHSVVFAGNSASGAPLATQYVVSKWGKSGLFRHRVSNVPAGYDTSSLQVWRLS